MKKFLSSHQFKLVFAFASVYLIWGSTYLAIRLGVQSIPPFIMAGTRHLIAGIILYSIMRKRVSVAPLKIQWRSAIIIGALLLLGGNGGVTWAEQRVPSGLAALLVATVPLWFMLLGWMQKDGARPTLRHLIGIVFGLIGLGILVGPEQLGGERIDSLGALALIIATLTWAAGSLYSRKAPLPSSPFLATGMEMIAGGLILIITGSLTGEWSRLNIETVTTSSFLALLYLIFFGSLVGFSAYIWLLKHSTPSRVSTYAYVNPVVAVILGWLIANEPITLRTILASVVIIGSVIIITIPKKMITLNRSEAKEKAEELAA